jgi:hypothetical protein
MQQMPRSKCWSNKESRYRKVFWMSRRKVFFKRRHVLGQLSNKINIQKKRSFQRRRQSHLQRWNGKRCKTWILLSRLKMSLNRRESPLNFRRNNLTSFCLKLWKKRKMIRDKVPPRKLKRPRSIKKFRLPHDQSQWLRLRRYLLRTSRSLRVRKGNQRSKRLSKR